jgi:hypothetical protein
MPGANNLTDGPAGVEGVCANKETGDVVRKEGGGWVCRLVYNDDVDDDGDDGIRLMR